MGGAILLRGPLRLKPLEEQYREKERSGAILLRGPLRLKLSDCLELCERDAVQSYFEAL